MLREWLIQDALLQPGMAGYISAILQCNKVHTLADLSEFAGHSKFDSTVPPLMAAKVRAALQCDRLRKEAAANIIQQNWAARVHRSYLPCLPLITGPKASPASETRTRHRHRRADPLSSSLHSRQLFCSPEQDSDGVTGASAAAVTIQKHARSQSAIQATRRCQAAKVHAAMEQQHKLACEALGLLKQRAAKERASKLAKDKLVKLLQTKPDKPKPKASKSMGPAIAYAPMPLRALEIARCKHSNLRKLEKVEEKGESDHADTTNYKQTAQALPREHLSSCRTESPSRTPASSVTPARTKAPWRTRPGRMPDAHLKKQDRLSSEYWHSLEDYDRWIRGDTLDHCEDAHGQDDFVNDPEGWLAYIEWELDDSRPQSPAGWLLQTLIFVCSKGPWHWHGAFPLNTFLPIHENLTGFQQLGWDTPPSTGELMRLMVVALEKDATRRRISQERERKSYEKWVKLMADAGHTPDLDLVNFNRFGDDFGDELNEEFRSPF
mmetsp:Transcript_33946/g.56131  ORF Transcript_33946/g.56131 Transcript_33946/m.56131 type:complete len:494 (-) Transcript_33946:130-1611(-)